MALEAASSSRPRRRTARVRTNYREPDSDSGLDLDLSSPKRSLPARTSRRIQNYNEDSDENQPTAFSSESETDLGDSLSNRSPPSFLHNLEPRSTRSTKRKNPHTQPTRFSSFQNFKRRKANSQTPSHDKVSSIPSFVPTFLPPPPSGSIPKWQNLEYQILLKIMQYASYPLYNNSSRDTGSMRWLLETSELCSSFHGACIGALMYSPPLLPNHRAHWLMNLLHASARQFDPTNDERSSRRTLSVDYRKKIKRLDIEVKHLLIRKSGINIEELLTLTPLLSELRLYHNHDDMWSSFIWAQPRYSKDKWAYGNLFEILDNLSIRLKTFEWNGRFLKNDPTFVILATAHLRPCLKGLRKLDFLNIGVTNVEKEAERLESCRSTLLDALNTLPDLQELGFQSCNVLDASFMTKLPINLTKLSFKQCPHITSDGLREYLTIGGHTLISLELLGNQVLDMGFMPSLKMLCPRLEYLTMDLNYSDPTSYRDTEPLFDELLPNGAPTWPENLSSIILGPLRSLSAADAEAFYESLIDAAPYLPHLRILVVKTLLKDISWRDRAKMRSKWLGLFEDVFMAVPSNPKSSHKFELQLPRPAKEDVDANSNKRKSARLRDLEELSISESQKSKDDEDESSNHDIQKQKKCNKVIFELSDQRPAQDQYTERDFLDDEPSDDGDWTGKDTETTIPIYSARHYAW